MERVELKKRIDKMQQKKEQKIHKQAAGKQDVESENEEASGDEGQDRIKEKKAKNLAKMLKYH